MAAEKTWMLISHCDGEADVRQVYEAMLSGAVRPDQGHVLSLCRPLD